jgi:hypothetical protein
MTNQIAGLVLALVWAAPPTALGLQSQGTPTVPRVGVQNEPVEWAYRSQKTYKDPFNDVDVDVVFTKQDDGQQWRVPAFWAGANEWRVRFAPPYPGAYKYRCESTDKGDTGLNGQEGTLRVDPYLGTNALLIHGPLRVSQNRRYFEHSDGTPFFWLGDTWWKGLCRRISIDEFEELATDRKAKGFTVVQIVAGLYPDEPPFDVRGNNEGGFVWEPGYARINPAYFDYADRRIELLVKSELVPAIVGSWGYFLPWMGTDKMKKHWRYLVARYGAYPVVWIQAGEGIMPFYLSEQPRQDSEFQKRGWTELAKYVHSIDPYGHLITIHPTWSARTELLDENVLDFDMLQTGHLGWESASSIVSWVSSHYSKTPAMPVLVGETVYEGHQQTNWQDMQRFAFWVSMMNGAAGHTYGAGGIWQMNGRTVPHGPSPWGITYENTPWDQAMRLPGSWQVGLGKDLLMRFPWWRFEPHPEWVEPHGTTFTKPHAEWYDVNKRWNQENGNYLLPYASGIPGKVRFIYIPPKLYAPLGPLVTNLEDGLTYRAFYFDPATGNRYNLGSLSRPEIARVFEGSFEASAKPDWVDHGGHASAQEGHLLAAASTWTVLKNVKECDMVVSVEARSDVEAGILLRFQDSDNSLVAVYSPPLSRIWFHDRQKGEYGPRLGIAEVPVIGPKIRLIAEAHGTFASLTVTDGEHTYRTSPLSVTNTRAGTAGVWSERLECEGGWVAVGQGGRCRAAEGSSPGQQSQIFNNFTADRIERAAPGANENLVILNAWRAPNLPLSHDWVLVLER